MSKKKTETTALVGKKSAQDSSALALPNELKGAWGTENAEPSDIIIPKLLLMHGSSKLVMKGKAKQGDLMISTTQKIVGDHEKAVSVVPFHMWKTYVISKKVDGKYQYAREDEYDPAETEPPWEFSDEEGNQFKREFAYNFYCLLQNEQNLAPTRLQFKSTSRRAGRMIANHFAACRAQKIPPVTKAWDIGSEFVEGDKNSWQAFTATQNGHPVSEKQMREAKKWYLTVTGEAQRVVHDEENAETADSDTKMETQASVRGTSSAQTQAAPTEAPQTPF